MEKRRGGDMKRDTEKDVKCEGGNCVLVGK